MIVETQEVWFSFMHIKDWTIFPWISSDVKIDEQDDDVYGWRFTWLCFDFGVINGIEI